jgi:membrane protein YdbS with pleckstrin-like domain
MHKVSMLVSVICYGVFWYFFLHDKAGDGAEVNVVWLISMIVVTPFIFRYFDSNKEVLGRIVKKAK